MAYWFAGFFARPRFPQPGELPANADWRPLSAPFDGVGVRLPDLNGEEPTLETIRSLATQLGFDQSDSWIYLTYTCWGGRIDSVYGFSRSARGELGPIEESDGDKVEDAFVTLMEHFGVAASDARNFEPFRRGFWGDA